jgi:hypothetical protein
MGIVITAAVPRGTEDAVPPKWLAALRNSKHENAVVIH